MTPNPPPAPASSLSPYTIYVLVCLMAAYMVAFADRIVLSLMIDPVRRDLALTDTQLSLLAGFAFAMFYAVLGLPIGQRADRSHRVGLITVGMVLWSCATVWCGAARSAVELFLARMTVGVGEASLTPASYSLIGDIVPRERLGVAMSIYAMGVLLGGGAAMMAGGLIVQWAMTALPVSVPLIGDFQGWRIAFLFAGLPGFALALLIALTIREPKRTRAAVAPGLGVLAAYMRGNLRAFVTALAGLGFMAIPAYAVVVWAPAYFARAHAMAPGEIGFVFGLILGGGGATAALVGGLLSDRLTRRGMIDAPVRLIMAAALGHAPLLVAAFLTGDKTLAIALFAAGVFVMSIYGGLQHATIQALTPPHLRGQMAAVYMMAANIVGLGLGPTLIAVLSDQIFHAIGPALAAVTATTAALALLLLGSGLGAMRATIARASAAA